MRMIDIIAKKRDGKALTTEEINFFIQGYSAGKIPDYQAAAWLMAVYLKGMNERETVDLTLAMARSGHTLDLKDVAPLVADKHSTGGVGDKTTLVVAPLVAATGLPVGKMSGRGLSFSGGTIDKLESIPGFRTALNIEEFKSNLKKYGLVLAGQSAELAPADGKIYSLRDATATVESLPLIASSIMSKKIASGADVIVLDVKFGSGAFMKTEDEALALARLMVGIGRQLGRRMAAVISDMNQPLGQAVGNALEVWEAIETLRGAGPPDFRQHCLVIANQMLLLAGQVKNSEEGQARLEEALRNGKALEKFRQWVAAQGGDENVADDPARLPQATIIHPLPALRSGYLAGIDAREIGLAAMLLGAGRAVKGETIDPAVGLVLHKKVGDYANKGEPLLTIHANDEERLAGVEKRLPAAYTWADEPPPAPALIRRIIQGT